VVRRVVHLPSGVTIVTSRVPGDPHCGPRKGWCALLSRRFAVLTLRFYRRAEFLDPVAGGIAAVPHFGA
jgi:hypothetical protein